MSVHTARQNHLRQKYGSWAVVTGASSGIGREIASQLAEAGLNLVLIARRQELLEQIAADLVARHGVEARVVSADFATSAGVAAAILSSRNLDVGLFVAAAGFGTAGSLLRSDLAQEFEMLDVNCRTLLALSSHFGRRFSEQGRGGMIFMASLVGWQGVPYCAHYAATKAYVQSLAEGLHVELKPRGVDVLASAPGPVRSGFATRSGMRMSAALTPADVASATVDALGRRMTVVPGALSKLLTYSLVPLPRPLRVRMMGRIMRGMTKHLESVPPDPKIANAHRLSGELPPDVSDRLPRYRNQRERREP